MLTIDKSKAWRTLEMCAGRSQIEPARLIEAALSQGRCNLSEPESKAFLRTLGIPAPPGRVVRIPREAAAAVDEVGPPVVVKAVSPKLAHKTDSGALVYPVSAPAEAVAACKTIADRVRRYRPDIELDGFLVEAFRPAELEWILAARVDAHFGPTIMFGLGGIHADLLRQIVFRLAPLRDRDIDALLSEKPAMRILDGVRGRPPCNRAALKTAIRRLSDVISMPGMGEHITEIEINPLTVGVDGILALDALVMLRT